MKKWRNTILISVTSIALAATAHWWVPRLLPLLGIVFKNAKTVGTFKDFVQVIAGIVALVSPFFKIANDKKQTQKTTDANPTPSVTNSKAGHDINVASGNIQTGGVRSQGSIHGDAVAGDKKTVHDGDLVEGDKYVIAQPLQPVLSSPHQLPPPPADFTGRASELAELRDAIEKGGVHISGLQGQGGVGKTALALKLAVELAPNYPDAQIYLDLKGVSEKPLTAAEAMSHVLRTFHPEADLPAGEDRLCPRYLDLLHDKRALLLMDNAKDAAQVRPLVPPPNCVLLVTSRLHFVVEGLHARNLDTLPPEDATKLLLRIAPRIRGEADAIAKLCGYLALALRLAATAIAEHIDLAPAEYRQKLGNEKNRLKMLGGDKGVEASIGLSYALLDAQTQKHWRMLAVFPDTFDVPAAAAVWTMETDLAKGTLSDLLRLSVLEWDEATERYRLHDLMRSFCRQKWGETEADAAALHHARHYLSVLIKSADLFEEGSGSLMHGLALFDVESGNVQAAAAWATAHATKDPEAAELFTGYSSSGAHLLLLLRQDPREQIRSSEKALQLASQLGDRVSESRYLGSLGIAYHLLGDYTGAIAYQEKSLAILREAGNRQGEGTALGNIGINYFSQGNFPRALEYHSMSLRIAREVGSRKSVGTALTNLGNTYRALGDCRQAIECHQEALAIFRESGDRQGEGKNLGNLGVDYHDLGDYHAAVAYIQQSLVIAREFGDRRGESIAIGNLGVAYKDLGDYGRAVEYYEQNLAIARSIADRYGEASALCNLGVVYNRRGDYHRAVEYHEQHLAQVRRIGNRQGEGAALGNLGNAYAALAQNQRAIGYYEQQLQITREIGDHRGEANSLWGMSLAFDKTGDRKKSAEQAEAALKILEEIEDPNAAEVRKLLEEWKQN